MINKRTSIKNKTELGLEGRNIIPKPIFAVLLFMEQHLSCVAKGPRMCRRWAVSVTSVTIYEEGWSLIWQSLILCTERISPYPSQKRLTNQLQVTGKLFQ